MQKLKNGKPRLRKTAVFNGGRQFPDVLDEEVVFDAGARNANGIDFLKRIQANGVGGDLPADDYQRN